MVDGFILQKTLLVDIRIGKNNVFIYNDIRFVTRGENGKRVLAKDVSVHIYIVPAPIIPQLMSPDLHIHFISRLPV